MTPDQITQAVSDASGVPIGRMKSGDRKRDAVCARHVAMYLIRKKTGEPFRVTSKRFNQNRCSAAHAFDYVSNQIEVKQTDTMYLLSLLE
jgi:chromosomal replication initiation ATPase DnaA